MTRMKGKEGRSRKEVAAQSSHCWEEDLFTGSLCCLAVAGFQKGLVSACSHRLHCLQTTVPPDSPTTVCPARAAVCGSWGSVGSCSPELFLWPKWQFQGRILPLPLVDLVLNSRAYSLLGDGVYKNRAHPTAFIFVDPRISRPQNIEIKSSIY